MKMLILGSSDTAGSTMQDPSLAFPWVISRELGAVVGDTVEVVDVPIVPVGPKAVPRAENALEQNQPDLVIFSFGAYHFIVGTVGLRVRRRYGERAYRLFRKAEVFFEGKTASPEGKPARLNRWGRLLARRVIGAEPLGTEEEVTAIHLEIMRLLAQREGLIVVVMLAPPLGENLERDNKGANRSLAKYREYMKGVARSHHFLVADCVPGFEEAARQGSLRHSDGVHKGAAGHRIQADAIMDVLLHPPSPLAEKVAAAATSS